jgi:hypothetical protein
MLNRVLVELEEMWTGPKQLAFVFAGKWPIIQVERFVWPDTFWLALLLRESGYTPNSRSSCPDVA